MKERSYIAIDLKSYYASVECVERHLNPLTTNLVVADESRTEKTICLAVSPSLKSYGVPGRPRLFEVNQKVRQINAERRRVLRGQPFSGSSFDNTKLQSDTSLELDFIIAKPRMAFYMEYSTRIYEIYLRHFAPEDIFAYSIDEVFIDATGYLRTYGMTAHELTIKLIREVLSETGITATAGIGTNMYLCKIAMDIVAKHVEPDKDGVRIAELDEMSYRRLLWTHRPLTDFWRVGHGYAKKLEANGLLTMGDIARCSLGNPDDFYNEDLLYKLFGVNAELLIDHAWGWEPCTVTDVKAYKPQSNSISSGQVLQRPHNYEETRLIVHEMADLLSLDLVDKNLVTDQIVLTIGYDIENLKNPQTSQIYIGEIKIDRYGRKVPKHAHGTENLGVQTSSTKLIVDAALRLFDRIINKKFLARRITIVAAHVVDESEVRENKAFEQMDLFTDYDAAQEEREAEKKARQKEKRMQKAVLDIKNKYGKNAVLKGMNLQEGTTARERNSQIGGHKA